MYNARLGGSTDTKSPALPYGFDISANMVSRFRKVPRRSHPLAHPADTLEDARLRSRGHDQGKPAGEEIDLFGGT